MKYSVNGRTVSYTTHNRSMRGASHVLANAARDLTSGQVWQREGYTIARLFDEQQQFDLFTVAAGMCLRRCWADAGFNFPESVRPEQYHTIVDSDQKHLAAVQHTKLLSINNFPVPVEEVVRRVSEMLGCSLEARNPYDNQRIFHFRVIRPSSGDNNPLHRDVWLEDYADCINLYIPVAGSDENSSLVLLPGSHLWQESKIERTAGGALIGGVQYNVPAVVSIDGAYEAIRPVPGKNEFLLFSPYLIHGGAVNFNENTTRISIELRLWRV